MAHDPLLFQKAWVGSANRSMSIKVRRFGPRILSDDELLSFKGCSNDSVFIFARCLVKASSKTDTLLESQLKLQQIFGIPLDQDAGENVSFSNLYTLIEDFFTKVVSVKQQKQKQ